MNNGGDAAEQVVRLSLEGFEVAAKLTGSAAKNVALLLVSVLKQEQQTKGKARLTNMIKSGKELKVFSIPNKDLAQFTKQAKRYGVLYCVLRDKSAKGDDVPVDIIARAEDASKIQRIVERFEIGKVDKAGVITQAEQDKADREAVAREVPTKTKGEIIVEEAMGKPLQKEGQSHENPTVAKTEKSPPSERSSEISGTVTDRGTAKQADKKPSDLRLFSFGTMDSAIYASQLLSKMYHGSNTLYKDTDADMFILALTQSDHTSKDFNRICNMLSEYGSQENSSGATLAYLEEHCDIILAADAVQQLAQI